MIYAFGEFELDEDQYQLCWRSQPLELEPKIFEVLAYLITNRERVVPKQELLDTLWQDQIVGEWSLTRTISVARKILEDAGGERALIQTVYGRGYRFVADVIERDPESRKRAGALEPAASGLVGRERQLEELQVALASSTAGRGRSVFIVGESGIGKSRLTEELVSMANAQGLTVHLGRCWENETVPPFWPWIQILREETHQTESDEIRERVGSGLDLLRKLMAEASDDSAGLLTPTTSELERFQLFDSVARFIKTLAEKEPLVLVFEDLHAADETSLRLLGFVGREISRSRVLIVATVRDDYLVSGSEEELRLSAAARSAATQYVPLEPLTPEEVAQFVQNSTGRRWSEESVEILHRQTGGNPFFLSQLATTLAEIDEQDIKPGRSLERLLPRGVRQSVLQRLGGLPAESEAILQVACVSGLRFSIEAVQRVLSEFSGESFEQAIEQLIRRGFLLGEPENPEFLHFTHGIVRDTLYAELAQDERGKLHRQIAEDLESNSVGKSASQIAELAHHFFEARYSGAKKQAYEYAILAGRQAVGRLAFEDARHHFINALGISDRVEGLASTERADLMVELGRCEQRAGNHDAATETLERAAEVARGMGDVQRLAQIAIISSETVETFGNCLIDPPTIRLLDSALTLLPKGDSSLRARATAALAINGYWDADRFFESLELADQAVEMSRRLGDDEALLASLIELCRILSGPEQGFETASLLDEGILLGDRLDVPELKAEFQRLKMWNLFADGRIEEAEAVTAALVPTYERLSGASRDFLKWWQNSRAIMRGEFELAEAVGREFLESAERRDSTRGVTIYAALFLSARWLQGRIGEVTEITTHLERTYPAMPLAGAFAARAQCSSSPEEARERLERLVRHDGPIYHKTWAWLTATCILAEVAVVLGDSSRCRTLYEALLPYAQRHVSGTALTYFGSVSYYLGQLARQLGWLTVSEQQLHAALEMHAAVGARPLIAWTRIALAELALERGHADDVASNAQLACEIADKLKMPYVADRARQLLA